SALAARLPQLIPESHRDRQEAIDCCHFAVTLMSVCCHFDSTLWEVADVKSLSSGSSLSVQPRATRKLGRRTGPQSTPGFPCPYPHLYDREEIAKMQIEPDPSSLKSGGQGRNRSAARL